MLVFQRDHRAAHTVGRPTSQVKMASAAAWSLIAFAICCRWINRLPGVPLARVVERLAGLSSNALVPGRTGCRCVLP
jgi:hypothetical protein